MLDSFIRKVEKIFSIEELSAHCDVPCGVYDPLPAQIAAMTVARMMDTITELETHEINDHNSKRDFHYNNKITRMINEKERSAEIVKEEVRIIWGDFYKDPQFSAHPDLHKNIHSIMLTASKCKQNIDIDASRELVVKLNIFAETFWKIKGIKSKKVIYHCKPSLEMIFPDL